MMEFFLSGSLPLIEFVICDVMGDMANKLLSLSLSVCAQSVIEIRNTRVEAALTHMP